MPTPIGTLEFFVLEAGEYLERLALLAGKPGGPAADELVRYARALRGSALMASQQPMSRAAAGLEALGRALREGRRQWDAECAEVTGQAVEELKGLLRQVTHWGADDEARAGRVIEGLQALAGPAPEPTGRRPGERRAPAGPDAGIRAFVAREAALVAGALDRAARALAADPSDAGSLHTVLRRMQSLRGLATLGDLPPLADILDGVERAIAERSHAPAVPGSAEVFAAAARALNRASTEVAGTGRPDPDAAETAAFAAALLAGPGADSPVVPVESLAPGGMEAIATRGREPAVPTTLELVGQGEFLVQAADDIERAGASALRALRLHALITTLQAAARPAESSLRAALNRLLEQVRAVAAPDFTPGPALLAALRETGAALRGLEPGSDLAAVGERLAPRATTAPAAAPGTASAPAPAAAVPVPPPGPLPEAVHARRPIESPALPPAAAEPVPITDLLAPAAPPRPPDLPSVADFLAEPPDLAGSFTTLARLRRPAPAGAAAGAPGPGAVRDVRDLLYRGRPALERALELRSALAGRLADGEPADRWRPLLDELFDLLPLAAEDA